jgi:hypothetical protein
MKQSAVEWLIEQLVIMDKQLDGKRKNEDATVMKINPTKIFSQAKEMEKQQIIDAHLNGQAEFDIEGYRYEVIVNAKQYYNETFKNK